MVEGNYLTSSKLAVHIEMMCVCVRVCVFAEIVGL